MPNFEAVFPECYALVLEYGAASIGLALVFVGFVYVMRVIKLETDIEVILGILYGVMIDGGVALLAVSVLLVGVLYIVRVINHEGG